MDLLIDICILLLWIGHVFNDDQSSLCIVERIGNFSTGIIG